LYFHPPAFFSCTIWSVGGEKTNTDIVATLPALGSPYFLIVLFFIYPSL
jgi:hypothetical protein